MQVVAIDFETANAKRSSVCAMGVAVIEGNAIRSKASWLIRPPTLHFDSYNTFIHGITARDVKDQPEFNELWGNLRQFFEGTLVIAHNASFDMSVLRHVLDNYHIAYPKIDYYCTRVIAKCTWPSLMSYSLPIIASHLGIEFKHHDAQEDAVACAQIALRACLAAGVETVDRVAAGTAILKGQLFPGGYKPCRLKPSYVRPNTVRPTVDSFDSDHPFFGKCVAFTGTLRSMTRTEAMQRVVDSGGYCSASITKSTDYLVFGDQDLRKLKGHLKSGKLRKAERLISAGAELEMLPEADLLQMLAG